MSRLTGTDISMAIEILKHPNWGDESDIRTAVANAITGLKELQHYKDLEEQGRLVTLPCKVGDTVYFVSDKYVHEGVVYAFNKYETTLWISAKYEDGFYFDHQAKLDWGNFLFLTKEEAEAKLAELKGSEE